MVNSRRISSFFLVGVTRKSATVHINFALERDFQRKKTSAVLIAEDVCRLFNGCLILIFFFLYIYLRWSGFVDYSCALYSGCIGNIHCYVSFYYIKV